MTQLTINTSGAQQLQGLAKRMIDAFAETIRSVVDRDLSVDPVPLQARQVDEFLGELESPLAVIRGALDKNFAGKNLLIGMPVREAITLAGLMMMTPEEVIEQRRQAGVLEGEDLESFGEVGNMLCSAADGILRKSIAQPIGARLQDTRIIKDGSDVEKILGDGVIVFIGFAVKIGNYPPSTFYLFIDPETAEVWNAEPFLVDGKPGDADGGTPAFDISSKLLPGDTPFEDIPQAAIRGRLGAYLVRAEVFDVIRRACRRLGLEVERHGRMEIPNPAAHRDEIVILDIPRGDDRRFEWAHRLKSYKHNTGVLLVLQEPNKVQVLQGFKAKADAIVGWPLPEAVLSQKLRTVMDAIYGPAEED